jgi:hypothetical protein
MTPPSDGFVEEPSPADRRNVLLCVGLVVAAILATVPLLEMGVNDDWSYAYTALQLARTGQWHYTGWTSPMLGVQGLIGAFVIRLAGFSFTVLRLTTIPLAAGCGVLLYRLYRFAGLTESLARFGTLVVVLSPIFVPSAASFMTDVPGLFFLLLCLYCGSRAVAAPTETLRSTWLVAAAVAGLLGGSIRQIVWAVPVFLMPSVVWLTRRDRSRIGRGAMLEMATLAAAAASAQWVNAQPYLVPEHLPADWLELVRVVYQIPWGVILRTLLVLLLPALAGHLHPRALRWPSLSVGAALAVFVSCAILMLWDRRPALMGDVMTSYGILGGGTELMGFRPVVVPARAWFAIATVGAAGLASLVGGIAGGTRGQGFSDAHLLRAARLFGPLFVVCAVPLVYRSGYEGLYDRHLLMLTPPLVYTTLWCLQRRGIHGAPPIAWCALTLSAAYSVATTHDYLSAGRARVAAASTLTAAGVPRTAISAGLEYDGWTELEENGYVNDARIQVPPGAYKAKRTPVVPGTVRYWMLAWTPSIQPEYFVVYSPQPGLVDSGLAPVPFTTWLPPSTRRVVIQTNHPGPAR